MSRRKKRARSRAADAVKVTRAIRPAAAVGYLPMGAGSSSTDGELVDGIPVPPNGGAEVALLLRVEEAAARLGIARTLMYQLVSTREVESVRVGRLRRIPVRCLEEYVERLRGVGLRSMGRRET
jgi:excisionase family DNA binding protein